MSRRLRLPTPTLAVVTLLAAAPAVEAQYPDAYVIPRGALRFGFEPGYFQWNERFDADGNPQPFGSDFSDSAAGVRFLPTLGPAQTALRALAGDSTLMLSLGRITTTRVADTRSLPLTLALGLTDRLTLTASLPIVTTRAQVDFAVDSSDANVGWNQAVTVSGLPDGVFRIEALIGQIAAAAAYVEAQIAAGAYGCPTSPACAEAQEVVDRAREAQVLVAQIAGLSSALPVPPFSSVTLPPFAPLASSAEGQALRNALQSLSADLQALGASALTQAYPLPADRVGAEAVNTVLTDPTFGYEAYPIEFAKYRNRLGDAEVGLRFGLVQATRVRTVLYTTVRLPTGTRDVPEHFVDLGTGDRQLDVELGAEAAWTPGPVALALRGSYTAQLSDELPLRVTPHGAPIVPAANQYVVSRDLGDIVRMAVYPSLRLSDAFTAYGTASYYRRSADAYAPPAGGLAGCAGTCPDPNVLAFETAMRSWSFGGGLHYRATHGRHDIRLPVEAGVDYLAAYNGSGGQTPKATVLTFYLRLYKRLWGGVAETAETTEATETIPETERIPDSR